MTNRIDSLSVTPTIARQTPKNEFGQVLKDTLQQGGAIVNGALMGMVGGVPGLSAAVSAVSQMANAFPAATQATQARSTAAVSSGITPVGQGGSASTLSGTAAVGGTSSAMGDMGSYMSQMRAEADRSLMMQMEMQNESREYNTVSNVLKVRHDSAKAAINNIR